MPLKQPKEQKNMELPPVSYKAAGKETVSFYGVRRVPFLSLTQDSEIKK